MVGLGYVPVKSPPAAPEGALLPDVSFLYRAAACVLTSCDITPYKNYPNQQFNKTFMD